VRLATTAPATLPPAFAAWFERRGWQPHAHQLALLAADRAGRSALLVAPTGGGKTLAGFLPSLVALAEAPADHLHTLYVSPLKALAVDIHRPRMNRTGYRARYFFRMAAPTVYFGSTKLPRRTMPHWLNIM
jgi:Lhr-like helicase